MNQSTNSQSRKKATVIGAGFGGLSAALRLRRLGYEVQVLDNNPMAGGRAQVYKSGGINFDAGPTVITAPFLFDELFNLFGRDRSDYIEFLPVEPWYRFHFKDKTYMDYGGKVEDTESEIERLSENPEENYRGLVEYSKKIFEVGFEDLSDKPFNKFSTMLRQVPVLLSLKSYLSVYDFVSQYIKDERLRRAFSIHPLLVGGNPFQTTSIYCLIHYLERKWGVWFPKGGTGALVQAIEKLSKEVGIKFNYNRTVKQILVQDGEAKGVILASGEKMESDIVVCDADPPMVYEKLIPSEKRRKWTDKKLKSLSYSMGLFVWYFSTKKKFPSIKHHTILFGEEYKKLLEDIFDRQILSDDLSLYLHRPSATDESMAPPDGDAFYVLAPVPNKQSGINWEDEGEKLKQRVMYQLETTIMPGLSDSLDESFFVTPDTFERKFHTSWGSGFSIAPLFQQSAWFRFHNKSEDVKNLFFCGAGTHPGAGVPGVVSSAKVMEKLVPPAREFNLAEIHKSFKAHSKTFSLASLLFPRESATAISQLYYVCRQLDDWADNGFEEDLISARDSWLNHIPHPVLDLYRDLQAKWGLAEDPMTDMLSTMVSELNGVCLKSESELIDYCRGVAGTVGIMTCPIIGVKDKSALTYAENLGIAMQLTNICRDVHEDAKRGRIYIPQNFFKTPISVDDLVGSNPDRVEEIDGAKLRLLGLAASYYERAQEGMKFIPLRARIIIKWAASMYGEIGSKIGKNPINYRTSRAIVPTWKKLSLFFGVLSGKTYSTPK